MHSALQPCRAGLSAIVRRQPDDGGRFCGGGSSGSRRLQSSVASTCEIDAKAPDQDMFNTAGLKNLPIVPRLCTSTACPT
jgi:hypothetical protein